MIVNYCTVLVSLYVKSFDVYKCILGIFICTKNYFVGNKVLPLPLSYTDIVSESVLREESTLCHCLTGTPISLA